MSDYSEELKMAERAAREAAAIIINYQEERSFEVSFKGKNDLVTDADLSAERKVKEVLTEVYPDDEILGEETSAFTRLPDGRVWLIDPIDGTTNFAHGFPVYCVSIALWEEGAPKVGVVLEVANGELFTAVAGEGARLDGESIRVSPLKDPAGSLIGTGFPYNDLSLVDHYLNYFEWLMHNTRGIRRPGAASYDLCCVACGRFDGFYEYSLKPWDVGAAALIVREAGGTITDWQGGQQWLFGQRIIAGNPAIHDFLLDGISNHFSDGERAPITPS